MDAAAFFICGGVSFGAALYIGLLLFRSNRNNRNPLDWSLADRGLLFVTIHFVFGGAVGFFGGIRIFFQVAHVPWVNFGFWQDYKIILGLLWLAWLGLGLAGLKIRRPRPASSWYAHAVLQLNALLVAAICYSLGPLTDPRGLLVAMAQGGFIFILFSQSAAVAWSAAFVVYTVLFMAAVWAGLAPYAPFFLSPQYIDGRIEGLFWASTLAQELMIFILLLFIVAYVVARWRDREARLVEMTALLKKMFGRYLSTEVMSSLIENPAALELGGERRQVTIMMTDLRGFTALSERLAPEQVVQMLNAYFEIMVEVVLEYQGTINEIIGDALLVIFGAPQEMPDRAQRAIACAVAMQNAMEAVNRENRAAGLPELEMGIGLNEAEVIVGNIGSSKRSKYTVVGSGVNMASRIESYTVGGQILISESVGREAGEILVVKDRMEVLPKGADSPLVIYDITGIGGRWNLTLTIPETPLTLLLREIRVRFQALEGKHLGGPQGQGAFIRLSRQTGELRSSESLEPWTNLKMNLVGVSEDIARKDFYGKVQPGPEETTGRRLVRFTALPPSIDAYFQAAIDQGVPVEHKN